MIPGTAWDRQDSRVCRRCSTRTRPQFHGPATNVWRNGVFNCDLFFAWYSIPLPVTCLGRVMSCTDWASSTCSRCQAAPEALRSDDRCPRAASDVGQLIRAAESDWRRSLRYRVSCRRQANQWSRRSEEGEELKLGIPARGMRLLQRDPISLLPYTPPALGARCDEISHN